MKVLVISNLYGTAARGGAEVVARRQVEEYTNQGDEVIVFTSAKKISPSIKKDPYEPEVFTYSSVNIVSYYNLPKINIGLRLIWHIIDTLNPQSYLAVKKWLKQIKPDLIISNNLKGLGLTTALALRKSGIQWQHVCHDVQLIIPSGLLLWGREGMVNSLVYRIYRSICRKLFGSPTIVRFPSRWLRETHEKFNFFVNSNKQVQNQPDLKAGNNAIRERITESKFLYAGQIEEHKGAVWLINNWPVIKKEFAGAALTMAGAGTLLDKLKHQTKDDISIRWLGNLNQDDLRQLMGQSSVLIVPSICYENAPNVIFEAKQMGLPVVASRIGGIPEFVDEKFLFTPLKITELVEAIKRLE